jgi:hypothetical protein
LRAARDDGDLAVEPSLRRVHRFLLSVPASFPPMEG